jgi:CubicO group peptidase (beta-lactamase class C family)
MVLSSESVNNIKSTLNAACDDANKGLPGVVAVAIGKYGKELFAHAAGKRGFGSEEPMTLENIFWIASCTKMITGVACMQLVEQGTLYLDDAEQVARLCPEIKNLNVLQADGKLVPAKRGVTLRMLLTHTGGNSSSSEALLALTGT